MDNFSGMGNGEVISQPPADKSMHMRSINSA